MVVWAPPSNLPRSRITKYHPLPNAHAKTDPAKHPPPFFRGGGGGRRGGEKKVVSQVRVSESEKQEEDSLKVSHKLTREENTLRKKFSFLLLSKRRQFSRPRVLGG